MTFRALLVLGVLLLAAGCSAPVAAGEAASVGLDVSSLTLNDQVVEAGCAMCMFGESSLHDCQTAIRVGDKVYLARGACVPDCEDHSTGLCSSILKARVTGRLQGEVFQASSFTVLP